MKKVFDEIRERIEGLKEVYDTMALDEALLIIDDVEEEYENGSYKLNRKTVWKTNRS